ncbi:hypothetical protein J2794_006162 [Paraburkholderia terricola]|uniref:CHAT domain-containing protein n=1 Tax=Paraburkholderia terricola TaxID=169427 RepID=UPI002861D413|nr:CHAT domain-containing protein [Paraburkholderia terricola]MDR6450022.1 hypothetical protein [Paraburkholderia terricola]
MPIHEIAGTRYYLVLFDEEGRERVDVDNPPMSQTIRERLVSAQKPVTDIFITSHGWKGDIATASEQYDKWIGAMSAVTDDIAQAHAQLPGFEALVLGLHWPSLPWGMEDPQAERAPGLLGAEPASVPASDKDEIVRQLAGGELSAQPARTKRIESAVKLILGYADTAPDAKLPAQIDEAYALLFDASGLRSGSRSGRPSSDHDHFDASAIVAEADENPLTNAQGTQLLGLRDVILSPLRQLSFWKMKERARSFGETGAHALLIALQDAAPTARIHLMGHSFGCVVVSAMVAGPDNSPLPSLKRPVSSLFLVQGALSLWSYAADIPYAPGTVGYFRRILERGLVSGSIVTTRSSFDTAVGRFYPFGARLKGQLVLGEEYPEYGGIGTFGIRGDVRINDMQIQTTAWAYQFQPGTIYNVDASNIIKNGEGASGAHSDIAHPEVAHLFWEAVLAAPPGVAADARTLGATFQATAAAMRGGGAPPAPAQTGQAAGAFEAYVPPPAKSRDAPGLLGDTRKAEAPAAGGLEVARAAEETAQRYINADLEDLQPADPLFKGKWYTLAFNVDEQTHGIATVGLPMPETLFPAGVEEIVLTVQLESTDFDLSGHTSTLRVPRTGISHTKARFDISPFHDGPSRLTAVISKDGNFVQQMDITIVVGQPRIDPASVTSRGRVLSASAAIQPRDLMLLISPSTGGYDCVVCGAVAMRARLPITAGYIDDAIKVARAELMMVVMQQDKTGAYVFQRAVQVGADQRDIALKVMARAGSMLLRKLFEGPAAGPDSKAIATLLRKLSANQQTRLKLQIVAESMPVPWSMLYIGSAADNATLDWNNFLGMRHVIEQIPLQNPMVTLDSTISSNNPCLNVGVNFNDGIDQQMNANFVARQREFWSKQPIARVNVTARSNWPELLGALNNADTSDQILYFYCHADSKSLTDPGGPYASTIVLTDAARTLTDIMLNAPADTQLAGNPLVFINACESAEMSPAFYDGFAPYFMSKGARGVIGTECKTPALFATEWAEAFFQRFLAGEPLGDAFLGLRSDFLTKYNNPLGLLYAVYCDGDTVIDPRIS